MSAGAITILSYAFSAFFISSLVGVLLIIAYVVVSFVFNIIRIFKPKFCLPYRTPDPEGKYQAPLATKKIALNFLILRSMEKRQVNGRREVLQYGTFSPSKVSENEWDLNALTMLLRRHTVIERPQDRKDLYTLSLIADHRKLCFKTSTKNGLKVAFANLHRKHWIVFDYESAKRWQSVVPNTEIIPANVYARLRQRQHEEKTNAKASAASA
jgi:hypothetical protein